MSLDSALFLAINGTAQSAQWLSELAFFSSLELIALIAAVAAGAFLTGSKSVRRATVQLVLAAALASALARLCQQFIPVDRPFVGELGVHWLPWVSTHSFPSAHASTVFAFATAVAFTTRRWSWTLAALAVALLVSWSRIFLGVHFPSDVLGGAVLGFACGWLVTRFFRRTQ